jgi:hypothetical protein
MSTSGLPALARTPRSPLPQGGAAAAATIGSLLSGLKDLVKQLEQSARSLLEQGNAVLGQQQLTLAGSIEAIVKQIEGAYTASVNKTADALTTQEMNVKAGLTELGDSLRVTLKGGAKDIQNGIYQFQSAGNQLLDKVLPLTARSPLLYGIVSKDVIAAAGGSPADVELQGYLLADPDLKYRKPSIVIDSDRIPESNITVVQGRVSIELPQTIRDRIRLANSPCAPARSFEVKATVFYLSKGGFLSSLWRLMSWADRASLSGRAVPGVSRFRVSVSASGTSTEDKGEGKSFSTSSGQLNFGCEETKATAVNYNAPAGARDLNATAAWRNTNNVKSQSQQAQASGLKATASGSITGLDYQNYTFVRNCPGGGHAELVLFGTYTVPKMVTATRDYTTEAVLIEAPIDVALLSETGLRWDKVHILIRRVDCDQIVDEIAVSPPSDPNQLVSQTSTKGLFTATLQRSQLRVSTAGAFASLK